MTAEPPIRAERAADASPRATGSERAAEWVYTGLWAGLVRWFRVPASPPTLPVRPGERMESFRPAPGFLRYLKFWFWIGLLPMDIAIVLGWIVVAIRDWRVGLALVLPAAALAVLPDLVTYVALHLRYDTMWYVFTDRSLRIRRGIWSIEEMTVTFENVQNVEVRQGPLQRWFGIADLIVETAAAGAPGPKNKQPTGSRAVVQGIADAPRVRDLILSRVRQSRSAGLGDEREIERAGPSGWTKAHLRVLREIREAVGGLGRG